MEKYKEIERSIIKKYRKDIFSKFIKAVSEYELIKENDNVMVCISGGKDSFLLAKCIQELIRHGKVKFSARYVVMDPGYNEYNRAMIEDNANSKAKELGCNKIALGHHFDDVIETTLLSMLYGSEIKTMMPKLHSDNFEGLELIRPLYLVKEEAIISWRNSNELTFINCACRFTEGCSLINDGTSKRKEMKELIKNLRKINKNADYNIFKSLDNVNLDCVLGTKTNGVYKSFLADYDKKDKNK